MVEKRLAEESVGGERTGHLCWVFWKAGNYSYAGMGSFEGLRAQLWWDLLVLKMLVSSVSAEAGLKWRLIGHCCGPLRR